MYNMQLQESKTQVNSSSDPVQLQDRANICMLEGCFDEASSLYETCITLEPLARRHYWALGLALLLQGQMLEAQSVWFSVISEGNLEEIDTYTSELADTLQQWATEYANAARFDLALPIYEQLVDLQPEHAIARREFGLMALLTEQSEQATNIWFADVEETDLAAVDRRLQEVIDFLLPKARQFLQSFQFHFAWELYHRLQALNPDSSDLRQEAGLAALLKGDANPAQIIWFSGIDGDKFELFELRAKELIGFLEAQVDHYLQCDRLDLAGKIRNQIQLLQTSKPSLRNLRQTQGWQSYQEGFLQMKETPYMDYPAHIHMETMSLCSAACNFCPYPTLERKGTRMPDELIKKIIDNLADIPQHIPIQLSPFKVNEPFLDHRLFDILKTVNAKLPNANITLTSNASPITESRLKQLQEIENIGYLWISFNDHRPVEYEQTMSLKYDRTLERLQMIHRYKAAGELPFKVVVSRVGDGTRADSEFVEWVCQHFPRFQFSVFQRGSWIGQVNTEVGTVPNVGCIRWFDISITSTGVVAHCCMDGKAEWAIGDVRNQHILEIYNQPEYRSLREKTLTRLDAEPCSRCTFL